MRHSLLLVLLHARDGMAPITLIWMALGAVAGIARDTRFGRFIWLPVFLGSVLGSFPVLLMLLAGGYALFGLLLWWAFPILAVLMFLSRPAGIFTERRGLVGIGGFVLAFVALFFMPRPDAIDLRVRFVESDGRPVVNVSFPLFVYAGLGKNFNGTLKTDAAGLALLKVYYPESGSIKLIDREDSRRNIEVRFDPASSLADGLPRLYKFGGKTVIPGNTDKEARIVWSGRRDH